MRCRMRHAFHVGFWVGLLTPTLSVWAATKVTSVDFFGVTEPDEVLIQSEKPITYTRRDSTKDHQVILELENTTLADTVTKKIDTRAFNGLATDVSTLQMDGKPERVRVVIQLKEMSDDIQVSQEGNAIKVLVPGETAVLTQGVQEGARAPSSENENSSGSSLDEYSSDKAVRKFSGKPITLQVRDADVADVLRLIGEASGFNIIISDDVKGKVTLSLVDVPWDQALDVVLHTLRLGAERQNNILRVVTLENLTNEKIEESRAKKAAELSTPRITRVFPVNYASLTDLQTTLLKFVSPSTSGTVSMPLAGLGGGSTAGNSQANVSATTQAQGGIVQIDSRTNSIIVHDLPENLDRIKKLIELLDVQTPQVVIEAKIVEATEGFSKNLSGQLGLGGTGTSSFFGSFNGANSIDPLIGTPGVFADGSAIAGLQSTSPQGSIGLSPSMSFIPGFTRLNALLTLGETESQVKVVASPKTVVLNKQKASILAGTPVLVPGTTTVAGVGTVPTTTVQSANVSLNVTPTVTNDGSVLLDLTVSKDVPLPVSATQSGIGNRNMSTLVLVESGNTLVIGGIYTLSSSHSSGGFPLLRKIPIIGALFGTENENVSRSELFIFITPRILNPKEAGFNA